MQYEAKTPEEYLNLLENDWRKDKLQELRAIITSTAPHFTEGIHYKMLSYSDQRGTPFHLNAQKNYVSLYVGDTDKIDPDGILLEGIDTGKGCIRFKKSIDIEKTRINEFIQKAVKYWQAGKDIDC